jgi:flagellar hook assembly protein FlgD
MAANVTLQVYDILGREIVMLERSLEHAGSHLLFWDGSDARLHPVPSGVYVLRVSAGVWADSRKIVILR